VIRAASLEVRSTRQAVAFAWWPSEPMNVAVTVALAWCAVLVAILGLSLVARPAGPPSSGQTGPPGSPTETPGPTVSPSSSPAPSSVVVTSRRNVFGAGHAQAPQPGGFGAGGLPVEWSLPEGAAFVDFPSVTGQITGESDAIDLHGPEGNVGASMDVQSHGGISGIVHHGSQMFLVGVFLTDAVPADPAPVRLDFTRNTDFALLAPEIGQTFLIGDGVGRRYRIPEGATRLFLGFADATFHADPPDLSRGEPGDYNNNAGELEVVVHVTVD
jgi:hypothetical protein